VSTYIIYVYNCNIFIEIVFRLSKQTFLILLHMIEDEIIHQTCRNNAISPVNQLLVGLRYYATGAFQVCFINDYEIT